MTNPPRTHIVNVPTSRFDGTTAIPVMREAELAFEDGFQRVVIDLAAVTFLDSLGVAAIASIVGLAPAGAEVRLASLGAYARTVARVTHLDQFVDVYATVAAAAA
jgi:anti-anti-sigma factor